MEGKQPGSVCCGTYYAVLYIDMGGHRGTEEGGREFIVGVCKEGGGENKGEKGPFVSPEQCPARRYPYAARTVRPGPGGRCPQSAPPAPATAATCRMCYMHDQHRVCSSFWRWRLQLSVNVQTKLLKRSLPK